MKDMQEYRMEIRKTLLQIAVWGMLLVVNTYFAGFKECVLGIILGVIASMVYFALLSYRIHKSADMPVEKAILYMRIGWLNRLVFIGLVLFISAKVPEFDFWATVVGLFSLHVVMFFKAVALILKGFKNPATTGTTGSSLQGSWHKNLEERRREDGTRWWRT